VKPTTAYIALGANLGNPRLGVLAAMDAIADLDGVALMRRSALFGSTPVDAAGGDYVNAVVEVHTLLSAQALLEGLQDIERRAGRERIYVNAPRTLDLDLLLYADARIRTPNLEVPHPRMRKRAFVLMPLHNIAPHLVSQKELDAVSKQGVWLLPPNA
jgi:2-amino-4-hydroxy-6-hydroxymethyldihydropteridine diphosphokinase